MFLNALTSDTYKMSRYCHTSYQRRKPCKAHSICITKLIRSRLGTSVYSIECLVLYNKRPRQVTRRPELVTRHDIWGRLTIGELDLVTYRKLDNQCIYQYLSLFATIRHYSLLFVTIRHYSSLFATIRHYSLLFVTIRHLSSLFATIRHYSRLFVTVRDYSRLFAVFGDYSGFITSRRRWPRKATLLY